MSNDVFKCMCAELLAIIPASGTGNPHSLVVARARALLAEEDGPAVPDGREPASVATQPSDGEVEKPAAWMCPAEPYWDGKEWRPRWQVTTDQELAEYWARPDKPTPLFTNALPTPEAQPVPEAVGPSADEWDALVKRAWDKYETVGYQGERFMYDSDFCNALDFVRRVLARWGRPAAPPVPEPGEVAELVAWLHRICFDVAPCDADAITRAADLLAQRHPAPPAEGEVPRIGHILRLAEIIREVDGRHDKGAAALAEAILSHPGICSAGLAAAPVPEVEGPSADELIGLALRREPWATWLRSGGCLESAHCELADLMLAAIAHWLPANALPLPAPEVQL